MGVTYVQVLTGSLVSVVPLIIACVFLQCFWNSSPTLGTSAGYTRDALVVLLVRTLQGRVSLYCPPWSHFPEMRQCGCSSLERRMCNPTSS